MKLDGGSIVGEGSLTATADRSDWGSATAARASAARARSALRPSWPTGCNIPAAGEGSIGDPSKHKAGDGVAADVAVSQKSDITVAGGQGATPGSSEVAKTYDPDAEGSDQSPSIESASATLTRMRGMRPA